MLIKCTYKIKKKKNTSHYEYELFKWARYWWWHSITLIKIRDVLYVCSRLMKNTWHTERQKVDVTEEVYCKYKFWNEYFSQTFAICNASKSRSIESTVRLSLCKEIMYIEYRLDNLLTLIYSLAIFKLMRDYMYTQVKYFPIKVLAKDVGVKKILWETSSLKIKLTI